MSDLQTRLQRRPTRPPATAAHQDLKRRSGGDASGDGA
jgi:hypothetical protein